MNRTSEPQRGEIWTVDLDPTRGHEQSGKRPALVVSASLFNQGPSGLVIVLPLTTRDKRIPTHIRMAPPEGGLPAVSFIKCEDIRSVSTERLTRRWGVVSETTLTQVEDAMRILLEL
jgi:mRNA interferase MazF